MKEGESTPSRPQSTAARDGHRAEAPRSSPLGRTSEPPTKLSDPISESRWHKFGRVALGYRRRAHATYIKALLSTDLRLQRTIQQVASKGSTLLATIVSVIISVLFYTIADSTDIKASEMHLAAAPNNWRCACASFVSFNYSCATRRRIIFYLCFAAVR